MDNKKQFFLFFAGVRGAMAFALALKSKVDFPRHGSVFLVVTLLFISFTLLYSSIFLDFVINKCGVLSYCDAINLENSSVNSQTRLKVCFVYFKNQIEVLNTKFLMPLVLRKEELQEPMTKHENKEKIEIKTEPRDLKNIHEEKSNNNMNKSHNNEIHDSLVEEKKSVKLIHKKNISLMDNL